MTRELLERDRFDVIEKRIAPLRYSWETGIHHNSLPAIAFAQIVELIVRTRRFGKNEDDNVLVIGRFYVRIMIEHYLL
ncbi:hypothetical protein D3093_35175 (plasmid) [Azospirillum argentinense]|uniref:Uncharacterized protein n=1 Tax=Azospirillum argentinense TaxID=2970906 RepID=A0A4D8Q0R0_9PROT|nr:hypothetical protein D3093_35175 [Azospirillum argentinense]